MICAHDEQRYIVVFVFFFFIFTFVSGHFVFVFYLDESGHGHFEHLIRVRRVAADFSSLPPVTHFAVAAVHL